MQYLQNLEIYSANIDLPFPIEHMLQGHCDPLLLFILRAQQTAYHIVGWINIRYELTLSPTYGSFTTNVCLMINEMAPILFIRL